MGNLNSGLSYLITTVVARGCLAYGAILSTMESAVIVPT